MTRYTKLSFTQIQTRIFGIFDTAKISHQDIYSINKKFDELLAELKSRTASNKPRYPYYVLKYAQGYFHALHDEVWKNHLEFCYVFDGEIYSTHEKTINKNADVLYSRGSSFMDSLDRGHYWKNTNKKFA